jgi:hypothetical protein
MSRVPITIKIDEFICTDLGYIRKMHKTRDYSQLMAVVERMQMHANAMESAIHNYSDIKYKLALKVNDPEVSDEDFRKLSKKALNHISEKYDVEGD